MASTPPSSGSSQTHIASPASSIHDVSADKEKQAVAAAEAEAEQTAAAVVPVKEEPAVDPFLVKLDPSEVGTALPFSQKVACMFVICTSAFCVTCASSMSTATFPHIMERFNVGLETSVLALSLFILGMGFGPLLFGGLSEFLGRNIIYRASFIGFFVLNFPVAFAPNIVVHLVFRFLSGFAGSAFLSLGGGSIADLFMGPNVATAVSIYSLTPFIGPIVGPIISGFINQYTSWRWTYYTLIIWIGVQTVAMFFIPETYAPTLTNQKAARIRAETGDDRYFSPFDTKGRSLPQTVKLSVLRPFQLMTSELMILLLNIWTSLELAIVYIAFATFPEIFGGVHGFTQSQVGLAFIGMGIGMCIGTATQPLWNALDRRNVAKYAAIGQRPPPECALYMAMAAAILAPIGLFGFAFTVYKSVHWIVPIILIAPFGTSVVFSFTSTFTFFVQTYRPMAASTLASNSFCRSSLSAGLPLAAHSMFKAMTNTGALAFLGGVMTLLAPVPFLFFKYGAQLRKSSKYAY